MPSAHRPPLSKHGLWWVRRQSASWVWLSSVCPSDLLLELRYLRCPGRLPVTLLLSLWPGQCPAPPASGGRGAGSTTSAGFLPVSPLHPPASGRDLLLQAVRPSPLTDMDKRGAITWDSESTPSSTSGTRELPNLPSNTRLIIRKPPVARRDFILCTCKQTHELFSCEHVPFSSRW